MAVSGGRGRDIYGTDTEELRRVDSAAGDGRWLEICLDSDITLSQPISGHTGWPATVTRDWRGARQPVGGLGFQRPPRTTSRIAIAESTRLNGGMMYAPATCS